MLETYSQAIKLIPQSNKPLLVSLLLGKPLFLISNDNNAIIAIASTLLYIYC